MNRRRIILLAATAALAACGEKKPQFSAVDLTGADYAKDFSLPDTDGKTRSIKDFRGKAVVVFFGYTQCPDVCPTTMAEIAQAKKLLGPDGDKVQAVFITVDPERDTPELLKAYGQLRPRLRRPARLARADRGHVAKDFKIYFKKVEGKAPGSYTMDHSAASFVFDPKGRLRLYTRYGTGAQALADDLKQLLATSA
jgi:protein SCO1/2